MITLIFILTMANSLAIIYIIARPHFSFDISRTSKKTLLAFRIWYKHRLWLSIPVRNKRKTEFKEEILRMLAMNKQAKIQSLSAKFSWLKTIDEVKQFEKDFSVIDKNYVQQLVNNFKVKKVSTEPIKVLFDRE